VEPGPGCRGRKRSRRSRPAEVSTLPLRYTRRSHNRGTLQTPGRGPGCAFSAGTLIQSRLWRIFSRFPAFFCLFSRRAFYRLKTALNFVPADTKLSKLDTLRMAAKHISFLKGILDDDNPFSQAELRHPAMSLVRKHFLSLRPS